MNELILALENYFSFDKNEVSFEGNETEVRKIEDHLSNMCFCDEPDGYSIIDNELLIVEHFRYDSSKATPKKGSLMRQESVKLDKDFDELITHEGGSTFIREFVQQPSLKYYIENAKCNFLKHYAKVDRYKERISSLGVITEGMSTKICFVLEDVSLVGNAYIGRGAYIN